MFVPMSVYRDYYSTLPKAEEIAKAIFDEKERREQEKAEMEEYYRIQEESEKETQDICDLLGEALVRGEEL